MYREILNGYLGRLIGDSSMWYVAMKPNSKHATMKPNSKHATKNSLNSKSVRFSSKSAGTLTNDSLFSLNHFIKYICYCADY